jgi:hypothetical protein
MDFAAPPAARNGIAYSTSRGKSTRGKEWIGGREFFGRICALQVLRLREAGILLSAKELRRTVNSIRKANRAAL